MTSFRADILDSSLIKNPKNELHDLCDQYTSLLDKHAPFQTKKVVEKVVGGYHALVMTDQNTATIEIYAIAL